MSAWHVTSFYRFIAIPADEVAGRRDQLEGYMHDHSIKGLVILAPEGINGTVAGSGEAIAEFKGYIAELMQADGTRFKDSDCDSAPFHRITVVTRTEIVGLKRPDLVPAAEENFHLTPKEWHEWLASDRPRIVIDTRNQYETRLGKFRDAVDPQIDQFSQWGEYVANADIPRDTPVLMYCTGGIRCEKAILEMHAQGFDQVYQLRDGILGYLEQYPDGFYEGECYVFDDRVSVGPDLQPTGSYGTCPGCGLPADQPRSCAWCGGEYRVCETCAPTQKPVCSKTCRDRYDRHGARNGARQVAPAVTTLD